MAYSEYCNSYVSEKICQTDVTALSGKCFVSFMNMFGFIDEFFSVLVVIINNIFSITLRNSQCCIRQHPWSSNAFNEGCFPRLICSTPVSAKRDLFGFSNRNQICCRSVFREGLLVLIISFHFVTFKPFQFLYLLLFFKIKTLSRNISLCYYSRITEKYKH